jgi:hypothetical protein
MHLSQEELSIPVWSLSMLQLFCSSVEEQTTKYCYVLYCRLLGQHGVARDFYIKLSLQGGVVYSCLVTLNATAVLLIGGGTNYQVLFCFRLVGQNGVARDFYNKLSLPLSSCGFLFLSLLVVFSFSFFLSF